MSVDPETLSVYAERAKEYGTKFTSLKAPRHLRGFMAMLPTGGNVLDFGCGHGSSAVHMAQAGFKVDAWDASAEMLALMKPHENLSPKLAVFDDLNKNDAYDGIWCNFSLLHAPRERMSDHLSAISTALRANGALHLGLKTGMGSKRDGLGRFYTYYSIDELRGLLADASFIIIDIEEGEEPGLAGPVEPFVIIKARKEAV